MTHSARLVEPMLPALVCLGVGLGGLVAVPAAAQLRADQGGGRALDANPGVNSAGVNRVENQVDYAARNDLITGNVAGGFGFQGSIGYTAPGAFRGELGSDSLFRFRADSLGSAPALAPLPSGSFNQPTGGNVVVYNNFTAVPNGRVTNSPTRFAPEGGAFRVNRDVNDVNPYQVTLDASPGVALQSRAGSGPDTAAPTNAELPVAPGAADPAAGQPRVTPPTRRTTPAPDARPESNLNLDPATGRPAPDPAAPGVDGDAASLSTYRAPASATRRSGDLLLQGPADNPGLDTRGREFADASGRLKPTLTLGQLSSNLATTNPDTLNQRIARIQGQIFGDARPGSPATGGMMPGQPAPDTPGRNANAAPAPGSDNPDQPENAYTRLLDEIRQQARDTTRANADTDALGNPDLRPEWMKAMDEPDEDKVRRAEETLDETLARIRREILAERDQREAEAAAEAQGTTPDQEAARQEANASFDQLMDDLSYNVRLETMVAQRENRRDQLFAEAEQQMAAGKFLNAERTYRQLRFEAPDNPLGLAGLIHAQLGAGMIRSAAFNLRALFEEHPELIATRYGPDLLPPADRLEWLQSELQRMIDTEASSLEPGLMLAYLGYQVESRQLVRYGLAIAEEAAVQDRLTPILRRIWLEGGSAEPTETTPTP